MQGKWIIFWDRGQRLCDRPKQVVKVTEKLIKFPRSCSWPRQIDKTDHIASFDSEEESVEALVKATRAYNSAYAAHTPAVDETRKRAFDADMARKVAALDAVSASLLAAKEA